MSHNIYVKSFQYVTKISALLESFTPSFLGNINKASPLPFEELFQYPVDLGISCRTINIEFQETKGEVVQEGTLFFLGGLHFIQAPQFHIKSPNSQCNLLQMTTQNQLVF